MTTNGHSLAVPTDAGQTQVLQMCVEEMPLEQKQGEAGHTAACWMTK